MIQAPTLNRAQRRAAEKAARQQPRRSTLGEIRTTPVNPLFAMDAVCRNRLATSERRSFAALLDHCATASNVAEIETLIETAIRSIRMAKNLPQIDQDGADQAVKVFFRAAWSLRRAKARHADTGVYGLDAADREALVRAEALIAEMRRPGVVTRKTWLAAFRDSYTGRGGKVVVPAFEELEPA